MSARPTDDLDVLPAEAPAAAEYDRDFYSWLMQQARLIREGRWERVDRENVAEEIESLGREQFNKLESALRVLLTHMLKWDHQSTHRGRSWSLSIKAQRIALRRVIEVNPGLKPRIDEATAPAYERARVEAARETGLEEEIFPQQCPYSWDDITTRDFSF